MAAMGVLGKCGQFRGDCGGNCAQMRFGQKRKEQSTLKCVLCRTKI